MARVCPKTKVLPTDCWCKLHKVKDADENERRRIVGTAVFEWKGGESKHVFVASKEGGEVSLCNLCRATPSEELRKMRSEPRDCVQCHRTLVSRAPNARMRRYFQGRRTAGS